MRLRKHLIAGALATVMQGLFIDLLCALEFSNEQFNDGFWSECWDLAPSGNISFCEAGTFDTASDAGRLFDLLC